MCKLHMVFLISLIGILTDKLAETKTLRQLFVIHRHGDRCPVTTYPTDPYSDEHKYFPDGLGMLTSKGKQRMYRLGKYIRKRYKNFLTDNPREAYVRSSAKERCLESVALLMAGLYPPVGQWKWGKGLGQSWQPFPIQTTNLSQDGMLNPDSDCPTAREEVKKYLRSDTVRKFFRKHENLINFVEAKARITIDHHWKARDLFNALEIQRDDFGLKLPEWVNETVYDGLKEFLHMSFIFDASTETLRRLRAGLLIADIRDRLKKSISEPKTCHKLIVYSTHDTQLTVFLSALNAYNSIAPPFGATIFLELYQTKEGYTLEMHYLNVTESEKTYRLPLKGISESSDKNQNQQGINSLEKFFNFMETLIPYDWEQECKGGKSSLKKLIKEEL